MNSPVWRTESKPQLKILFACFLSNGRKDTAIPKLDMELTSNACDARVCDNEPEVPQ